MDSLKEELAVSVAQGKLKDGDILAYKGLLSSAELDKLSLEEQNAELQRQISKLKDIKLSSMEEKLNKTIDLLNELTASVVENRAISYAVGDTICGAERFKSYVERAKEELKNE
jgi:C4-type Zn-finger protein